MNPVEPVLIRVIETAPTGELGYGGILLQALGLTGLVVLGSLLLGLALGALFIWLRTRRPWNATDGDGSEQVRLRLEPPQSVTPRLHGSHSR